MSYQDEVHNAVTCSSPTCPCHEWSQRKSDEAILNDIDAFLMSLSPFAAAWASAPETQRRYTERDCAAYWFERGQKANEQAVMRDLAEMNRLMREKGLA